MAITKVYQTEIISLQRHLGDIYTVEFRSLGNRFKYKPGQFLHLALSEYVPSAAWPESRCFSMQSSPDKDTLSITFSVKGEFTKRLADVIQIGRIMNLKLPYGDLFIQKHRKENAVFIAGGTGITPFLSLFGSSSFSQYVNPSLYVGFRNRNANFYRHELQMARQINSSLKIETYYEEKDGSLDIKEIFDNSENDSTFFVSGPPEMIASMKQYILAQDIEIDQFRSDDWQ